MRPARSRSLFILFVAACAVAHARPARAQGLFANDPAGWSFRPSIALGYDTFGQTYTISDRDTLDLVDEMSGRLVTTLRYTGPRTFELRNSLGLGEEATRNDLRAVLRLPYERFELRATHDAHYRGYRSTSEFNLSSDYLTNISRVTGIWKLSPDWRLRVDDRFEHSGFAERTRYSYDYWRNDTSAEIERRWGLLSSLRSGYTYGKRGVPDSTSIDYDRHVGTATLYQTFGMHTLSFQNFAERRLYRDPNVRSHYLDYQGTLSGSMSLADDLRLRPTYVGRVTAYDQPDSVYTDATEQSAELLLEKDLNARATLGIGPRSEFRRTQSAFDRPYNQYGVKGSISYLAGSFWMQFTNEFGVRSYFAGSDFIYSDYVFNWSTLYLSYSFRKTVAFDLYFSLSPESHEDEADNTTTILVSSALTWHVR